MANESQKEKELLAKYEGAVAKLDAAEAEVKAAKAAAPGKEVAELRAANKKLLGELAEVKAALEATKVKPGQYLAVTRIKEDGEVYLPGSIYKGTRAKELAASGSLKMV